MFLKMRDGIHLHLPEKLFSLMNCFPYYKKTKQKNHHQHTHTKEWHQSMGTYVPLHSPRHRGGDKALLRPKSSQNAGGRRRPRGKRGAQRSKEAPPLPSPGRCAGPQGNDAQAHHSTLQFPNTGGGHDPWPSGMTLNCGLGEGVEEQGACWVPLAQEQGLGQEQTRQEKALSLASRGSRWPSHHWRPLAARPQGSDF